MCWICSATRRFNPSSRASRHPGRRSSGVGSAISCGICGKRTAVVSHSCSPGPAAGEDRQAGADRRIEDQLLHVEIARPTAIAPDDPALTRGAMTAGARVLRRFGSAASARHPSSWHARTTSPTCRVFARYAHPQAATVGGSVARWSGVAPDPDSLDRRRRQPRPDIRGNGGAACVATGNSPASTTASR